MKTKILFINTGTVTDCFISSSIIKGLKKKYKDIELDVIVDSDVNCKNVFLYNKLVKSVNTYDDILTLLPEELLSKEYDVLININTKNYIAGLFEEKAREKFGFGFSENADSLVPVLYGDAITKKNMFQVYYNIAGLSWKGEGYDFFYHPKYKSNKNKIGLAIANSNLKSYIIDKLELDKGKLWTIPLKENIFKRADEVNRCGTIITDDFLTMNIASHLHKKIHFLKSFPYNYDIELFKYGKTIDIPTFILR